MTFASERLMPSEPGKCPCCRASTKPNYWGWTTCACGWADKPKMDAFARGILQQLIDNTALDPRFRAGLREGLKEQGRQP